MIFRFYTRVQILVESLVLQPSVADESKPANADASRLWCIVLFVSPRFDVVGGVGLAIPNCNRFQSVNVKRVPSSVSTSNEAQVQRTQEQLLQILLNPDFPVLEIFTRDQITA